MMAIALVYTNVSILTVLQRYSYCHCYLEDICIATIIYIEVIIHILILA